MITPSTEVARGSLSNAETRNASRADGATDFREEVSRERARGRTTERAADADASRRDAAERSGPTDRADEHDAVEDETRADPVAEDSATDSDVDRETQDPARPDARAPAAEAKSDGSANVAEETAAPRTTKAASDPATPNALAATVAPALETLPIAPSAAQPARATGEAHAREGLAPDTDAVAGVGSAQTKPVAASTTPAVVANTAEVEAHGSEVPEGFDVPTEVRSTHTSESGSSALAIAARATAPSIDVSPTAQTAPIVAPRLTPAELPQFLQTLQVRVDGAAGSALVELEPRELGRLTVELSLQPEGGVRADVRAERPDGYAAIEARLPELRASLIERGFASADVHVSLGLAQRDARGEHSGTQPRRAQRNTARDLDVERVLALAPSRSGSIDVWA